MAEHLDRAHEQLEGTKILFELRARIKELAEIQFAQIIKETDLEQQDRKSPSFSLVLRCTGKSKTNQS